MIDILWQIFYDRYDILNNQIADAHYNGYY